VIFFLILALMDLGVQYFKTINIFIQILLLRLFFYVLYTHIIMQFVRLKDLNST